MVKPSSHLCQNSTKLYVEIFWHMDFYIFIYYQKNIDITMKFWTYFNICHRIIAHSYEINGQICLLVISSADEIRKTNNTRKWRTKVTEMILITSSFHSMDKYLSKQNIIIRAFVIVLGNMISDYVLYVKQKKSEIPKSPRTEIYVHI